MHNSINPRSVLDTFTAYTGRGPQANRWDTNLLTQVEAAMCQLLNASGEVYNYARAGQFADLDRTYRNDIRTAMRVAGFVGEPD